MIVRRASIGGRLNTRTPLKGKWRLFTVRLGGRLKRCADEHLLDNVEVPQGERMVESDDGEE